jgi:hypothetical protein
VGGPRRPRRQRVLRTWVTRFLAHSALRGVLTDRKPKGTLSVWLAVELDGGRRITAVFHGCDTEGDPDALMLVLKLITAREGEKSPYSRPLWHVAGIGEPYAGSPNHDGALQQASSAGLNPVLEFRRAIAEAPGKTSRYPV